MSPVELLDGDGANLRWSKENAFGFCVPGLVGSYLAKTEGNLKLRSLRRICSVVGDMMRLTKIVLSAVLFFSVLPCLAAGDSCLEHLGGGMSDVYCYIEQAKMADDQSIGIYKSLKGSIPVKSVYRKRIERFLSVKDPGGYCEIVRGLASSWGRDINQEMSIKVGDVEYYECIYKTSVQKLNKMKGISKVD